MYIVEAKTAAVQAVKAFFADDGNPDPDFRDIPVSIEYPVSKQDYPSIWVDFEPNRLVTAGIGHSEDALDGGGSFQRAFRWRFAGDVTLTVVAFTSMERDRLFDAVVRMIAFSGSAEEPSIFRSAIDANPFIGMNMNLDTIEQRGFGAGQGTPWGTDEMIYEATLAVNLQGEFVADSSGSLFPLTAVKLWSWEQTLEFDPTTGTDGGRWIG